jgi:hypothetical protein
MDCPRTSRAWIPPVLLARQDTTTSTLSANAVLRSESMLCFSSAAPESADRASSRLNIAEDDTRTGEVALHVLLRLLAANSGALAREGNHLATS